MFELLSLRESAVIVCMQTLFSEHEQVCSKEVPAQISEHTQACNKEDPVPIYKHAQACSKEFPDKEFDPDTFTGNGHEKETDNTEEEESSMNKENDNDLHSRDGEEDPKGEHTTSFNDSSVEKIACSDVHAEYRVSETTELDAKENGDNFKAKEKTENQSSEVTHVLDNEVVLDTYDKSVESVHAPANEGDGCAKHKGKQILSNCADQYLTRLLETNCFTAVSDLILDRILTYCPERLTGRLLNALTPQHMKQISVGKCPNLDLLSLVKLLKKCSHVEKVEIGDSTQLVCPDLFLLMGLLQRPISIISFEQNSSVTDECVHTMVRNLPHLRSLNISYCDNISDKVFLVYEENQNWIEDFTRIVDGAEPVKPPCSLTSVDISGNRHLSSCAVKNLTSLAGPCLRYVDISYTWMSCISLFYLAGISMPAIIQTIFEKPKFRSDRQLTDLLNELKERNFVYDELLDCYADINTPVKTNTETLDETQVVRGKSAGSNNTAEAELNLISSHGFDVQLADLGSKYGDYIEPESDVDIVAQFDKYLEEENGLITLDLVNYVKDNFEDYEEDEMDRVLEIIAEKNAAVMDMDEVEPEEEVKEKHNMEAKNVSELGPEESELQKCHNELEGLPEESVVGENFHHLALHQFVEEISNDSNNNGLSECSLESKLNHEPDVKNDNCKEKSTVEVSEDNGTEIRFEGQNDQPGHAELHVHDDLDQISIVFKEEKEESIKCTNGDTTSTQDIDMQYDEEMELTGHLEEFEIDSETENESVISELTEECASAKDEHLDSGILDYCESDVSKVEVDYNSANLNSGINETSGRKADSETVDLSEDKPSDACGDSNNVDKYEANLQSVPSEKVLPYLRELRSVEITDCTMVQSAGSGVASLGKACSKLQNVNLRGVVFISNSSLLPYLSLGNLTHLLLAESQNITDVILNLIAKRLGNKSLILRKCPVSDTSMQLLAETALDIEELCVEISELVEDIFTDMGHEAFQEDDPHLPQRSGVYAPSLHVLELEYSDLVNDKLLQRIVNVCRGTLKVTDYYGMAVEPELE
ncbi:hypothetical protein MAR_033845 [Mya arenaria]|uniref:Uncharacterized protein n=1 Tax=Mya arenaria TaxID=6604 RepID=A0ABY7GA74_MYAAR|nr:hypothetical protein MAR_033845 [Mya arenaria]